MLNKSRFFPIIFWYKEEFNVQKLEQLYEGKAKKVFKTDDPEILMVDYKDDATAFVGVTAINLAGGVANIGEDTKTEFKSFF